ncbi:MAG TPA: winged helix-turn-helix domain-containing protein [Candidatus Acidoferrales bacterium]|nr:winged helix-turn-helix domain-containing protein [Candidatus Acidoferrales bacterium]
MIAPTPQRTAIRFEIFEVDLQSAELRKRGQKIRLQEQPFRILAMLLERPGDVVTREEIRQKLWPADTFVDFDHGLNSAVARLREALNDSADNPRFVETVPRQGYRFICHVDQPVSPGVPTEHAATRDQRKTSGRNQWIAVVALVSVLAGLSAWWFTKRHSDPPPASIEVMPLAGMRGYESDPEFSPDGRQVAFVDFDGQNSGIYIAMVGGERSLRLSRNVNDCCPTWSPDGRQVAFLRLFQKEAGIYVVPALGGTEHRLYTEPRPPYPSLSWSPDGKLLAFPESDPHSGHSWITLFGVAGSGRRILTSPPDTGRDDSAVFSPDGLKVAFVRGTIAGVVNDVYVVPAAGGEPERLTFDNRPTFGLSWTPDSHEIVFSSTRGGQAGLWRVSASGGTPRSVPAGAPACSPSMAPKGNLLAYEQAVSKDNIWRISLADETHSRGPATVLISEKGSKVRPHFSPDGRKIAFESDRLGSSEIWVCDSDGGDCSQLTSLHGTAGTTAWSPDGRYLAFEFHPTERAEIYLVELPSGVPRLLSTIPGADNLVPSWSRDGKWIYFTSKRGNAPFQLWKTPLKGGPPVQITKSGGLAAAESADGRFLYYSKFEADGIWKMPLNGGPESRVLDQPFGYLWFNWALGKNGIYFLNHAESSPATADFFEVSPATVDFFDFSTGKITRIAAVHKPMGGGLALSPDGKSLLYVETEFEESSIMLLKNFR